jgi:tripartite ATP-independent transporter DctP family solute receptor
MGRVSKRGLAAAVTIAVGVSAVAWGAEAQTKLRFSHVTNPGSIYDQAGKHFGDVVKEKTNGQIEITVFPSGQLGQEREVIEGAPLGVVDLFLVGVPSLTGIFPALGDSDLPFLYRDSGHAGRVLEGEIGAVWANALEAKGIKGLGWGAGGYRSVINNKKRITRLDDFRGMKFRIAGGPVYLGLFRALGANAIQMTWGEVYGAMQQGVIDGLEAPPNVLLNAKLHEVGKYVTLDEHTYSVLLFGMSLPSFNKLTPDQQRATLAAGKDAGRFTRDLADKLDQTAVADLEKAGVTVDRIDKAPLVKAVESVYRELAKDPAVVSRIQATQ